MGLTHEGLAFRVWEMIQGVEGLGFRLVSSSPKFTWTSIVPCFFYIVALNVLFGMYTIQCSSLKFACTLEEGSFSRREALDPKS